MKRITSWMNWFEQRRSKAKGRGAGHRADLRSHRGTFELLESRVLLTTWYVNPGGYSSGAWPTPAAGTLGLYNLLASGSVKANDSIWVEQGSYSVGSGSTSVSKSFVLPQNVGIYGGFSGNDYAFTNRSPSANVTTLSGNLGGGYFAYHVVADSTNALTSSTILDGFTITAGAASGTGTNAYGGGIYLGQTSSPTLSNLVISGNSAASLGGGMYDNGGSPTLTNVTFSSNTASQGGGMYNNGGAPVLGAVAAGTVSATGVTFSGNTASLGGGMYDTGSSPILTNVTFSANVAASNGTSTYEGGGMYNYNGSVSLTNVVFTGNTATSTNSSGGNGDGGGMYNTGSGLRATLNQVTFANNTAAATLATANQVFGGGLYNDTGTTVSVTNGVFYENTALSQGGGIYDNSATSVYLTNCTFDANTAQGSSGKGGAIFNGNSTVSPYGTPLTVTNSIFTADIAAGGGAEIYSAAYTPATTVSYSLLPAGSYNNNVTLGAGIITLSPLTFLTAPSSSIGNPAFSFTSPPLEIQAGSPAVDNGNPSGAPAVDVLGLPRGRALNQDNPNGVNGYGNGMDIGAYQSQIADTQPAAYTGSAGANVDYTATYRSGGSITFSGSATTGSSAIALYQWDPNYNGTTFHPVLTSQNPILPFSGLIGTGYDTHFTLAVRVYDEAGPNGVVSTISTSNFDVYGLPASVTSVSTTPTTVTDATVGSGTFSVSVTYNAAMSSSAPSITFSPSVPNAMITPYGVGTWNGANTVYTAAFSVSKSSQYFGSVSISVSGGTDSSNNMPSSYTKANAFNMDTVDPAVTSLTTSATVVAYNAGGGTFAVTVGYGVPMSTATAPTIQLSPPNTYTGPSIGTVLALDATKTAAYGGWNATDTQYTAMYDVTTSGLNVDTSVGIAVSGAQNTDNNTQQGTYTVSNVFTIDITLPTVVSVTPSKTVLADGDATSTFTLSTLYSKPMNKATVPSITMSSTVLGVILIPSSGTWSPDGTTFNQPYTVVNANQNVSNVSVYVSAGYDADGNGQTGTFTATNVFTIEMQQPAVTGVVVSTSANKNDYVFADADTLHTPSFSLTVTYNVLMSHATAPTITTSPNVLYSPSNLTGSVTSGGGSWTDALGVSSYTANYNLIDTNTQISSIGLSVSGALDAAGNTQSPFPLSGWSGNYFSIDTANPTVSNVTVSPSAVTSNTSTFTATINFNKPMDSSTAPTLTFSQAVVYNATTNPNGPLQANGGTWITSTTFVASYVVRKMLSTQQPFTGVVITVSNAVDADGNLQITSYTSNNPISIDTNVPAVTSMSASPTTLADNNDKGIFTVTVNYSKAMNTTNLADTPVISFPNQPQLLTDGTLTLSGASYWQGSQQYVAIFNVSNKGDSFSNVNITVSGAYDTDGNPQNSFTLYSAFNVAMVAPKVSSMSVTPTLLSSNNLGSKRFTVSVTYTTSVPLNTGISPTITFTADMSSVLKNPSTSWSNGNTTFTAIYDVSNAGANIPGVGISVSGAQDTNGNQQPSYTWQNANKVPLTFDVLMLPPTVSSVSVSMANVQATTADFANPAGVAVDSAGDLFIADTANNWIREVNHSTGVITTVAGNSIGTAGYAGDNGLAVYAELNQPTAVAVDRAGDLFIADTGNNVIREVSPSGVITTVAGNGIANYAGDNGQASAAELSAPSGVAVDNFGDLFIADFSNNVVREVNLATGVITTVAGNGASGLQGDGGQATAANLSYPAGVAVDNLGDLFIADYGNNAIREVNLSSGVITTVAGNGTPGYGGDNGQATTAMLYWPSGVAVDTSGDLFIADQNNNVIREVNQTGTITTIAGNGAQGYGGDYGQATAAELSSPASLALDGYGNLFIADPGNNRIRDIDLLNGVMTTYAGNGQYGKSYEDLLTIANVGTQKFSVIVTFNQSMNGSSAPTISFSPSMGGVLTAAGGSWLDVNDLEYQANFNVAVGAGQQISNVAVTVSGGEDANDNIQTQLFTGSNLFSVDMESPTVQSMSVSPTDVTQAAVSNTAANFAVTMIYNKVMNTLLQPIVTLSTGAAQNSLTFDHGTWNNTGTTYTAYYQVLNDNQAEYDPNASVTVVGAVDADGNQQSQAASSTFTIDMSQPVVSSVTVSPSPVVVANEGGTFTVVITYAMNGGDTINTSVAPSITFNTGSSGAVGSLLPPNKATGIWSNTAGSSPVYTMTYRVQNYSTLVSGVGISVTNAQDSIGNPQASYTWPSYFNIDTTAPAVTGLAVTTPNGATLSTVTTVNAGQDQVIVAVTYNNVSGTKAMNTGVSPSITFTKDVSSTLVLDASHSGWFTLKNGITKASSSVYTAEYNVVSSNTAVTGVQVNVSNGSDSDGNVQAPITLGSFNIDTQTPTVSSISFYVNGVLATNPTITQSLVGKSFQVYVTYNKQMSTGSAPTIVLPSLATSGSTPTLPATPTGGNWTSINNVSVYVASYMVAYSNVNYSGLNGIQVSGATDAVGNVQVGTYVDKTDTFSIATQHPAVASVSVSTPTLLPVSATTNGGVDQFSVSVTYIGAVNPNVYPTLTFQPAEGTTLALDVAKSDSANAWNGQTYTAYYNVSNSGVVTAGTSGVGIVVNGAQDPANGNQQLSYTWPATGNGFQIDMKNPSVHVVVAPGAVTGWGIDAFVVVADYDTLMSHSFVPSIDFSPSQLTLGSNPLYPLLKNGTPILTLDTTNPQSGWADTAGISTYTFFYNVAAVNNATDNNVAISVGNAAEINNPGAVAVDSAGDIFIADAGNNRIREVNHATGLLTTVAGNGTAGYSGDNGPATAAALKNPTSLVLDSAGDLFIADSGNNVIREVSASTGLITTVAGNGIAGYSGDNGPATAAELSAPAGIAVDSKGDLFIADTGDARIREVIAATGVITTVAGNGTTGYSGVNVPATAAELSSPKGLALDSAGNLFIADSGNNRVREVSASTGLITTVAGNGTAGYGGDNAAATAAALRGITNIAVDSAGDIFIADSGNARIREVSASTHLITTVAGNGTASYTGDGALASAAEFNNPTGIAVDSAGDLFIADALNARIREVNASSHLVSSVAGNGTAGYGGDGGPALGVWPQDTLGNQQLSNGPGTFSVNLQPSGVSSVSLSPTVLGASSAGRTFTITVYYAQPMRTKNLANQPIYPIITFTTPLGAINTAANNVLSLAGLGSWSGTGTTSTQFTATYNVTNANVTIPNVGIQITGAEDNEAIPQMQIPYNGVDNFNIEMQDPAVTVDYESNPSVSVNPVSQLPTTSVSPVYFTVKFSENGTPTGVKGFAAKDITLGGTAPGTLTVSSITPLAYDSSTGLPDEYEIAVSGMTNSGTVTASVAAGATGLVDQASNPNAASTTSLGNKVSFMWRSATTPGLYNPNNSTFLERYTNTAGPADVSVSYGLGVGGGTPLAGDWLDTRVVTPGLYTFSTSAGGIFDLQNPTDHSSIVVDYPSAKSNWLPVVGDWTGSGTTRVGLYDPTNAIFHLVTSYTVGTSSDTPATEITVAYGAPGNNWLPVVGNWTGNGVSDIGLFDPATSFFYEKNSNASGYPDSSFSFGPAGKNWIPLAGDWTDSGASGPGLYDPATAMLYERNTNTAGYPDQYVWYGVPLSSIPAGKLPWKPVVGGWATPGQPEFASQVGTASASPLTAAALQPIVTAAIARWTTAGVPGQDVSILDNTRVVIGNLPGAELGQYFDGTITVSPTAAGNGWFVDTTPNANEEFSATSGSENMQAIVPQAVDRIDLLTVVEHELGHAIGLADQPASTDTLMSDTLPVGIRRTPDAAAVAAVFAAL